MNKEYFGADEIYISPKTNEIYTAYHFGDTYYIIMREREMPSSISWFVWEPGDESLLSVLKSYVDLFESMDFAEYMAKYNGLGMED